MKKIAEDTAARLKEATMFQQGPQKSQVRFFKFTFCSISFQHHRSLN